MAKVVPNIINANGRLDPFIGQIEQAVDRANKYALAKLNTRQNVDIIFSDDASPQYVIPESHVGGYTHAMDVVAIAIDSSSQAIKTDDIFLTICHELCHASRWQYNDEWSYMMIDSMIFEGLAAAFEIEAASDNNIELDYFAKIIADRSDEDNKKIFAILRKQLISRTYDRAKIFFDGDEALGLPRWAGYSLGYYFVKNYMADHDKKASDIFVMKYAELEAGCEAK